MNGDVDAQLSPAGIIQRDESEHQECVQTSFRRVARLTCSLRFAGSSKRTMFVYRLMEEKVSLGRGIDEEQQVIEKLKRAMTATTTLVELSGTRELQEVQIGAQEIDLANWKSTVAELKQQSEDLGRQVREEEFRVHEDLASAPQRQAKAAVRSSVTAGNPFILVLIDGSAAPFNGRHQAGNLRWNRHGESRSREVEKDLRDHNIELDEDDEEQVPPVIMSIVWHNRSALVYNLKKNGVLRGVRVDDQWGSFLAGWTSLRNNQAIDVGEAPIDRFMANTIELYGQAPNLKRIFIAGIHLETLLYSCEKLKPGSGQFFVRVAPKLVLVNHRETDDEREVLKGSGWRVAVFNRFFGSKNGLGTDLGWAFRPVAQPVGPGDQNHEEGDDENGFGQVYNTHAFDGSGAWDKAKRKGKRKAAAYMFA